jgi:uncharacterized membrane protein
MCLVIGSFMAVRSFGAKDCNTVTDGHAGVISWVARRQMLVHHHHMASLAGAHVMVRRDGAAAYVVVDAETNEVLAGPFDRQAYAVGCAHSLACKRGSRVLDGVRCDTRVIATQMQEAQERVSQLLEACQIGAHEIAAALARMTAAR